MFKQRISINTLLGIFFICILNVTSAQDILNLDIKKSLAIKPSDISNRSVNQKNMLEYLLITDKFTSPIENEKLFKTDTSKSLWTKISTNDKGWYEDVSLRGGYAYLEIESDVDKNIILEGSAYSIVYVNREPRAGNVYQYKDEWQSWEPDFDFSYLPINLKKGKNEFIFKCFYGRFKVRFFEPEASAQLNVKDLTIPDIRVGEEINHFGGVIVINNSDNVLRDLIIITKGNGLENTETIVPIIQPLSTRKMKFDFKGQAINTKSEINVELTLIDKGSDIVLDKNNVEIRVLNTVETYKQTFVSNIDGSIQFFAVNPSRGNEE